MKTLIPTVAMLLLTAWAYGAIGPEGESSDCRTDLIAFPSNLSTLERVEFDLMNGVWTETFLASNARKVMQFNEYGIVDVLNFDENGIGSYSNYMWRMEEFNGHPFLVLNNGQMEEELLFRIESTCQGLILSDPVSQEEIQLDYTPRKPEAKVNYSKAMLIGSWSSVTYPFDVTNDYDACGAFEQIEGAYLNYEFTPDGAYVKRYGSKNIHFEERGTFELSKDGQYILFHASGSDQTEDVIGTSLAKVRHLSMGELVLEQALKSSDFADFFCTELKTVAFMQ